MSPVSSFPAARASPDGDDLFASVNRSGDPPETLDEQPMAQPAVADDQRVGAEQHQHAAHDARTGEDDLGPVGLQADDPPAHRGRADAVELQLALDLDAG